VVLTNSAHWSCSNPLLALISSTGLLSPLAIGDLTVTATYGGLSATASITIL
jgi:hypothetical protein